MTLKELLAKIDEFGLYDCTCSAEDPQNNCVTYALNGDWLMKIGKSGADVVVLVPPDETMDVRQAKIAYGINVIPVEKPDDVFVAIHNHLNKDTTPDEHKISRLARVHPKAHIGADGMKYVKSGNMLINMKHMGNVYIDHWAEIGPFSTVARATLDSTYIGEQVRIGHGVYIGHNCSVGRRTIIVDGAVVGGSARIGKDCWLGLNCTVRNGVKICDNVFIGMGALVSKDIEKPGVYVGIPARRRGDWDGSW